MVATIFDIFKTSKITEVSVNSRIVPDTKKSYATKIEQAINKVHRENLEHFDVLRVDKQLTDSFGNKTESQILSEIDHKINAIKKDFFHKILDSTDFEAEELEGNTATISLMSVIRDLESIHLSIPNDQEHEQSRQELFKLINKLKETLSFAEEREAIIRLVDNHKDPLFDAYNTKVRKRLQRLQTGESLLLQGGTRTHSMLYEFTATVDAAGQRTYQSKILNSGQGVRAHISKSFWSSKYQSYIVEGIRAEKVESLPFLSKLFQRIDNENGKKENPIIAFFKDLFSDDVDKIYKAVNRYLIREGGGRLAQSNDPRCTHRTQNKGICSRKVYQYWLKENLSLDSYKRYKVDWTSKSIESLHTLQEEKTRRLGASRAARISRSFFARIISAIPCLHSLIERDATPTMLELGAKILEKRQHKAEKRNFGDRP